MENHQCQQEEHHIPDPNTWPSQYYGRTRHVDIEQLYNQLINNMSTSSSTATPRRSVSFSTEAPTVYEYEAEFEPGVDEHPPPAYEEPATAYMSLDDTEYSTTVYAGGRKKKSAALKKLDLRPLVNHDYNNSKDNNNEEEDDKHSVASSECSLPTTPPDVYPSSSLPQPLYNSKPETSQNTYSITSRSSLLFRLRTSPLFNQRRKTTV
ncbi:hypothetical protein BDC45DRAFT_505943, partial [Circinella umbellata]